MTVKFHSAVLFVRDIHKTRDFYTRILEQQVEHDFNTNVVLNGGLTLWQLNPEHAIAKKLSVTGNVHRTELYFESDRIDAIAERLKREGTFFFHDIKTEPWGQRTIRFFDPDNHLVEVGEPMEVFVRNMHRNGLSDTEISEKSGIPLSLVRNLLSLK